MLFSGMIKFKLLRIKITKKYILFFLHFRIKKKEKKKKKRKKDYTTKKHFNSEKEKEEKEEEKIKDNKKID